MIELIVMPQQHFPQFLIMKFPKFVRTFALICNKTKLPQSVTQACHKHICNTYIFLLLSFVAFTITFVI